MHCVKPIRLPFAKLSLTAAVSLGLLSAAISRVDGSLAAASPEHEESSASPFPHEPAPEAWREPGRADFIEFLERLPLLETAGQGGIAGQSDLSLRGSSFSEVGINVAGLTLRNPQTEHFHSELPLPPQLFTEPRILTGLARMRAGSGHFIGDAALDFAPLRSGDTLSLGLGDHRFNRQSLISQRQLGRVAGFVFGATLFGGRTELGRGLDYPDNTLRQTRGGLHLQARNAGLQADLAIARQAKDFGVRGFYGVSPTLRAEEKTRDLLALFSLRQEYQEQNHWRIGFAHRRFDDDYRLPKIGYRNQHRSHTAALLLDGWHSWADTPHGLDWQLAWEDERLASGSLGNHRRDRLSLQLLPRLTFSRWAWQGGARVVLHSDHSRDLLPMFGAEYRISEMLNAYADYTQNLRLPSYTELNYESPASLGNRGLRKQRSQEWQLGIRHQNHRSDLFWRLALFQRRTDNTIDWVKTAPDSRWQAVNLQTATTTGIELETGFPITSKLDAQFTWSWLDKAVGNPPYASRYALDYPEQRLQSRLVFRPLDTLTIDFDNTLQYQTANPERRGGRTGWLSSLTASFSPQRLRGGTLSLSCRNLWDDRFETIPGQRPAGRLLLLSYSQTW